MPSLLRVVQGDGEAALGRFRVDGQGRVSHRCHAYGYAKTLYGRVNGESVKMAYWCPDCREGVLLEEV